MEKTPEQEALSKRLDEMWDAHIIACLAIITAWQERERKKKEDNE